MIVTDRQAVPARLRGYDLRRVSSDLWRVVRADGRVVGHLALTPSGVFEARRFHARFGGFVALGTFCRVEEAIEVLHHSG
jgi:hypothetical protein